MHFRRTRTQLHVFLILALALPLAAIYATARPALRAASPAGKQARFAYVVATGHNMVPAIKRFYDSHGGLDIFGLPLTELIEQDGMRVQYFERARFELHPELPAPYYISLTLLGSILTRERAGPAFAPQPADTQPSARAYFPATGHTLGGAFGAFWLGNGQIAVFGYPISEEFHEVNQIDGKIYLVQYFERARFEYHPEHAGTPYEVLLGQLGDEYARARELSAELRAPAQPVAQLATATLTFAPDSTTGKNMRLAAARLDGRTVEPGQALSYNKVLGEVSARAGYLAAPAIVDGRIRDDVGGGICRVSTLLYRAVFAAGLPIDERHGHSRMISYVRDQPGMDAAVYAPNLDLRWRNDTPNPITIVVDVGAEGRLTVALWGVGDGRTTSVARPKILKHAFTVGDPDVQPATYIEPAMDVVTGRVVRDAAGKVIRSERILTHYEALEQVE
ncbi:MAG TPA: VanW family protein [Roseiflexaceae bacterium]|nr:VanW family protein [Roseiflexaceae bacterium]